jgi:iron(III) transport system substrate-binding protein
MRRGSRRRDRGGREPFRDGHDAVHVDDPVHGDHAVHGDDAMRGRAAIAGLAAVAMCLLAGCGGGGGADLVVYSGRSEPLIKPILDDFAEQTGMNVSVRFADTTELAATLLEEGDKPRADIFIGQDAGALQRLDEEGRIDAYDAAAQQVPADFRAKDGTWTGLSARARVLIINNELIPKGEEPGSIWDLTDARYKGKVAAPNATNASWIGFVSALREKEGAERTREWLEGMKANDMAVLGSHSDVRAAVGSGEYPIGLVNHYYVELEKRENSPVRAVFTDQGADEMGTVVNVASGGVVKGSEHPENARKLLDYLLSKPVQEEFAGSNFEYPVVPGVPAPGLTPLDKIKMLDVPLWQLGHDVDSTLSLLEEVGLGE